MDIKKHYIYLANLEPRFGSEPGKTRPVAVIQTDLLNNAHPSTLICPLTTQVIRGANILRVHIKGRDTGLKKDSDILVDQVRAIDNRRLKKQIGKLKPNHCRQLTENLKILLFE